MILISHPNLLSCLILTFNSYGHHAPYKLHDITYSIPNMHTEFVYLYSMYCEWILSNDGG